MASGIPQPTAEYRALLCAGQRVSPVGVAPRTMTIAKRLIILLGVPLVALLGLGVFIRIQLARIEERGRFAAEFRIVAFATLGNLSRGFAELRVNVRSYLLATTAGVRTSAAGGGAAALGSGGRIVPIRSAFVSGHKELLS
jgi:hypothetical protein